MRLAVALLIALLTPALAQAGNRLAGESSLYLRQHADQPVDWYPWGPEALEQARRQNKPIFVSVGYAACHWCHVMARESFENDAIAATLNRDFISIKIDRERRPDLDEQFTLVTTLLTGTSGWPNSVFLTPEGAPYHAGGYFPPDDFAGTLAAVAAAWENDRAEVRAFADGIARRLRAYLDQTAELAEVSPQAITAAARAAIADLDPFNGGFGDGLKFPRESLLLFLLDQAARHGDSDLLHAVTLTLDGMIRGGLHDHAGGGFHRYAVDPDWLIPHFEKMLYNQALIARVLLRAFALTGHPDYARATRRTLDFVLRDLRAPSGAFYAARDADSILPTGERAEGRFYVWTPDEVTAALGDQAADMISAFNIVEDGLFEGHTILHLAQSPLETAAMLGLSATEFDARLDTLRAARSARPAPIRDEKIILSWNAEMVATLAEAATVLSEPRYLAAAETAARDLLARFRTPSGLMRIHFDGRSDTPAQLTDYAALGTALLALHDHGTGSDWLATAEALGHDLLARFADDGKPMRLTAETHGLGPFRPLDDTELASGNALALAFLAGLDRRQARTGDAAPRLAATLAGDALALPQQRSAILAALEQSRFGPSGPLRVSSGGAATVLARPDREADTLTLAITLRPGWHLNAHRPLEEYLIGVKLASGGTLLPASAYPAPVIRSLGFSDTPLALYEDGFTLTVPLTFSETGPARAQLTLQACNDAQCLPPDDMVFWVWPHSLQ